MEKTYKVRAYNIDYCVEDEDVCSEFDNDASIEEDSEEYYDAIHKRIAQIKSELPQDMLIEVKCEEGDTDELEELVTDTITNETGWLIVGYDYDIL